MWKFSPIYKKTLWGGSKISAIKNFPSTDKIGECWLLSSVEGSLSLVTGGPDHGLHIRQLIEKYGASLLGKTNFTKFGHTFPLLIKIIDACADLSVQVHPDDSMAQSLGHERGKTEMWYVLPSDPGATLINGFNHPLDCHKFSSMVADGSILEALRTIPIEEGDVFFIPAGRVHSIGAGSLIMEIQQTSDDTFRIYDYGRLDTDGQPRKLHLDLALRAINFDDTQGAPIEYTPMLDVPVNIVKSPYFTTNVLHLDDELLRDYSEYDTFVIIICTDGHANIRGAECTLPISSGELVLVPASTDNVSIIPDGEFSALEVYIRP